MCLHGEALRRTRIHLAALASQSDSQLISQAASLRSEARNSCLDTDFPSRSIALITEAIRRAHGITAYDCQLLAGHVLASGSIAEMATGEGKTLVALLPAFVFALHGKGTHIATVNPYLAARDFEFASKAFTRLGMTVGLLLERAPSEKKRAAYACDITYGVGTEFGFDYLRDQLLIQSSGGERAPLFHESLQGTAKPSPPIVQRGHHFAVIDEADSILIDEARSPLIISTSPPAPCKNPAPYLLADQLACTLRPGEHFENTSAHTRITLSESGRSTITRALTDDVLAALRRIWPRYIEQALHARHRLRRDVHYIISNGKVVIVDEFTGRPCPDRTWRDGLHQAIEAAANIQITEENDSEATITRPAYFRLYHKVCGLTGTAAESAAELDETYHLPVRIIPLHRPCQRQELPDRIFTDRASKLRAVAADITARHAKGQPVLVGTRTIANSEELAEILHGFPFRLLNAKQDADEAGIIAQAGEPGTVTIATNMAGRGAHIPLPAESESYGGLHVIGLERHESARIDRQLIGRASRQGQPGSAQFFLSLEDDLISHTPPRLHSKLTAQANIHGELPSKIAVHFLQAQRKIEAHDRASRRTLAEHDKHLDELKRTL